MTQLHDLSGSRLGDYHLIKLIKSGGMADVYLGERSIAGPDRQFRHRVAIKVLTRVGEEDVRRFGREMEILLALHQHHPNIVRVLDYAAVDGGPYGVRGLLHYIVMDYLPGGTLADYMVHREMTIERFLGVLGQVADALDAAHRAGVIHRDIKPSNILFDRTGNAYLTDFGIAKLAVSSPETRDLTGGQLLGTVAYMAPEMFDHGATLSQQIDIYSLGVVTYLVLGGQLPFDGDQPTPALIKAIYLDTPPLLSEVNPDVSPRVAAVVQRAMARQPDARFPTGAEFVRALRGSFDETVTLTSIVPPPEFERMARSSWSLSSGMRARVRRWRKTVLRLAAVLAVVAGIGWAISRIGDEPGRGDSPEEDRAGQSVLAAATSTPTVTSTVAAKPTNTAVPTVQPTAMVRLTNTAVPTIQPTATVRPTNTAVPTIQPTATVRPTDTAVPTIQPTATVRPTNTALAVVEAFPGVTPSATPRATMVGAEHAVVTATTLITNGEYANCYAAGMCLRLPTPLDLYVNALRSQQPIQGVSWHAAQTFCRWWGGRLPTQLEWQRLVQLDRVEDNGLFEWVIDDLTRLDASGGLAQEDASIPACRGEGECVRMAANESQAGETLVSFRCVVPQVG